MIVACQELTPLIAEILEQGLSVRMTVTGNSMRPFIFHNETVLLTSACQNPVALGDVVLAQRPDGNYVLHRIVRIDARGYHFAGDSQRIIEGPVPREKIIARAYAAIRNSREKRLDRGYRWLAALLWIRTAPLGPLAIACAGRLARAGRRF